MFLGEGKRANYIVQLLLYSIYFAMTILAFYGSSFILNNFYSNKDINVKLFLSSILFVIFCWIAVTLRESSFMEKIGVINIVNKNRNIYLTIVNFINSFLLILLFINSIKPFYFIILYIFYSLNGILFTIFFNDTSKKVLKEVAEKFDQNFYNALKQYYNGNYKYILIVIQLLSALLSLYLYENGFLYYSLPIVIFIFSNELIYWTIRIRIYLKLNSSMKK